jgi:hypothetical protein
MREKINTKEITIGSSAMYDVELVNLMSQALEDSIVYHVKVDAPSWDVNYKHYFSNNIKQIDHWQNLKFDYDSANDLFVFSKR